MFRSLIALAPKKKVTAAAIASKAKASTASKTTKKSVSPKRKATVAPTPKKAAATASPRKAAATASTKKAASSPVKTQKTPTVVAKAAPNAATVSAKKASKKSTSKKSGAAAAASVDETPLNLDAEEISSAFGVVDTKIEEKTSVAKTQITEDDDACFTAPTPKAAELSSSDQDEPSQVQIDAAFAECEAAENEFSARHAAPLTEAEQLAATEDLAAVGTFSDEPTDHMTCLFEDTASAAAIKEACQFESEGLEIAPAEAELDASSSATKTAASTPTVAVSESASTEATNAESLSAAIPATSETQAAAPLATEDATNSNSK